jgi:uncharacterized membrane protein YcaP (DUF421 family)
MSHTVEIVIRNVLAFFILLLFTKLIGKQMIANSAYHLFVVSALLGTIAGNLAFNLRIKLLYFILSLFITGGIGYLLSWITLKYDKTRKWIFGESAILVKDGMVQHECMKKSKCMMDLETNGTLSVLKKNAYRNATKQDIAVHCSKRPDDEQAAIS